MAKFGIALEWGSRGLEFESRHSDQIMGSSIWNFPLFYFWGEIRRSQCGLDRIDSIIKNWLMDMIVLCLGWVLFSDAFCRDGNKLPIGAQFLWLRRNRPSRFPGPDDASFRHFPRKSISHSQNLFQSREIGDFLGKTTLFLD